MIIGISAEAISLRGGGRPDQRPDRRRLRRARRPLRARRRRPYRVIAYRTAAKAVRDASVSVDGASRARAGHRAARASARRSRRSSSALDETGDIPAAVKLRAKFPIGLIVGHAPAGLRAKRARRLYDELGVDSLDALRAAAEEGEIRELRGLRRQGRGEPAAACWPSTRRAAGRRRGSCSRARCPSPSRSSARCASTRPPTGRGRRLAAPARPTRPRTSTSSPPPSDPAALIARAGASCRSSSRCAVVRRRRRARDHRTRA